MRYHLPPLAVYTAAQMRLRQNHRTRLLCPNLLQTVLLITIASHALFDQPSSSNRIPGGSGQQRLAEPAGSSGVASACRSQRTVSRSRRRMPVINLFMIQFAAEVTSRPFMLLKLSASQKGNSLDGIYY
jgi:hypothetical protein